MECGSVYAEPRFRDYTRNPAVEKCKRNNLHTSNFFENGASLG